MTNVTHNMSPINETAIPKGISANTSECNSNTRLRAGHHTRATEHTSHIGMNTTDGGRQTHSGHGGVFSMSHAQADSVTPTMAGTEKILDYPYAFDQDLKHEVDFQEKLYRANNEVQRAS